MFTAKDQPAQHGAPIHRPDRSPGTLRPSANLGNTHENAPFIFSDLRTLFRPRNPQTQHLHSLAHSLTHSKNVTPAFPSTSALFLRSCASVQCSTPLLSCACALFVKNTRVGARTPKIS